MKQFLYLRVLRHVDYSVFCVNDGQKTYYDPLFEMWVPYSSGQQVKRSILNALVDNLCDNPAPVTFVSKIDKNGAIGEGEAYSACNPKYADLLLGGWMQAKAGGTDRTLKRRSPLSISALKPLHPLLAGVPRENISYDRSDRPDLHKIIVKDSDGNILSPDQVSSILDKSSRSLLRKYIQDNKRATGFFTYDVAIDLRTLFCVSTNQLEPEISKATIDELIKEGWIEGENAFGKCLIVPRERREKIIAALAKALLNWRITSNQSRTFSLQEDLAIAISDNANTISAAIRTKMIDEGERPKAKPIVDENTGADVFITLPCAGYISTEAERANALKLAEERLIQIMKEFDYEHQ